MNSFFCKKNTAKVQLAVAKDTTVRLKKITIFDSFIFKITLNDA